MRDTMKSNKYSLRTVKSTGKKNLHANHGGCSNNIIQEKLNRTARKSQTSHSTHTLPYSTHSTHTHDTKKSCRKTNLVTDTSVISNSQSKKLEEARSSFSSMRRNLNSMSYMK